jgi:hypothetical protein
MSAFPLVVIGVAVDGDMQGYTVDEKDKEKEKDAPKKSATDDLLWQQAFTQTLSAFLPQTAAFPLVKRLVLVPSTAPIPGSAQRSPASATFNAREGSSGSGLVCHAPTEGADTWVHKLLGEIVGEVFGELGELVSGAETYGD